MSHLMTKPTRWYERNYADSEDWWDWVDAQADLSLRWVQSHFVDFVMKQLSYQ